MGENSSFSTETQSFKKELMHFNPEIPLAGTCPAGQSAQNSITEIYPVIEAKGSISPIYVHLLAVWQSLNYSEVMASTSQSG